MSSSVLLSTFQKEALVGTMLGDAYNTRVRFEQSYPAHESYLHYLYTVFKSLTLAAPRIKTRKADKRTGLVYLSIAFSTRALPVLNYYRELFYPNGKKVVPSNIKELFMDDGGITVYNQTLLHTNSFTRQDVELLQAALLANFNLRTRLINKRPGQ